MDVSKAMGERRHAEQPFRRVEKIHVLPGIDLVAISWTLQEYRGTNQSRFVREFRASLRNRRR
jgi:hypothetical protein